MRSFLDYFSCEQSSLSVFRVGQLGLQRRRTSTLKPAQDGIQLRALGMKAVGTLADKIAVMAKVYEGGIARNENISSLDADSVANIRQAVVQYLTANRLRIDAEPSADCDVRITLSQSAQITRLGCRGKRAWRQPALRL